RACVATCPGSAVSGTWLSKLWRIVGHTFVQIAPVQQGTLELSACSGGFAKMRIAWIVLAVGFIVTPVRAQQKAARLEPATVPGAVQFDLPSQATGRTYRIYVLKPPSPPPAAGYPVVFLTDGDLTFGSAATRAGLEGLAMDLRPSLIVAIGYASCSPTFWLKLR